MKKILSSFLGILAIQILLHSILRVRDQTPPVRVTHRGVAGSAPENTLIGIKKALDGGARFIEVDLRRSADGALVLMHDATVNRTTNGSGAIDELTLEQLGRLDAGSHFSSEFAGEGVPTLDATLELISPSDAVLVIEVKSPASYPGIEEDLAGLIRRHAAADQVIIVSFAHDWLRTFQSVMPEVRTGSLWFWALRTPSFPPRDIVDVHWSNILVDPTLVRRLKKAGFEVWVWTVDSEPLAQLLGWLGVDGITSNLM